jgi:hypothetical protein
MLSPSQALTAIPAGLRTPLLDEYQGITQAYFQRKWLPLELSGGRFCEVVYTILVGHAAGQYPAAPNKPKDFPAACKTLENNAGVPRSFQILIPRLLPALYEIRNNRGVGHVGGDVDPNFMDATAVISMANWVIAELVRVLHGLSTDEAQAVVDGLVDRKTPIIWQSGDMKRVLNPRMKLPDQVLLLVASCPSGCSFGDLVIWLDAEDRNYLRKVLTRLHSKRFLEVASNLSHIQILPPGAEYTDKNLWHKG